MSNRFFTLALVIGLAALAWVGWSFIGTSWLALVMTAVIAAVYGFGAFELRQFRATTAGLRAALQGLNEPPAALADWLDRVPASLRPTVRSRIEGERAALPGPSLTPYLVGLLVMLGMLGTFLGMVVTFKGAVFALQGSTDLQAIRSALAEPIRGLGLSFGTSVAGVAASAMLGLMSAIARRERVEVARLLDARITSVLHAFSLTHHRQETVRALQAQADSLPQVVTALNAVMERMERRSEQLDAQLLERQAQLQREVSTAYTELARKVGVSLQENLAANARLSGETVKPIVEEAMAQVVQESQRLHQRLGEVAQTQVDALSKQFAGAEQQRLKAWTDALEQRAHGMTESLEQRARGMTEALELRTHGMTEAIEQRAHRMTEAIEQQAHRLVGAIEQSAQQITDRASEQSLRALEQASSVLAQSTQLVESRTEVESRWLQQHGERMDQLAQLWRTELGALRNEESRRGDAAVQRLSELEGAVAQHLATLGAALEAPITRLLATASEVPQAAAGVITQLREEMNRVAERDNLALQERTVLLERLGALVQSLEQASGEQRTAIEALVGSATSVLEQAHGRFAQALETQAEKATDVATQASGSAAELGALAESFGASVRLFQASHDKLTDTLQRVEGSLTRSTARSDEQLAYYVAQAREVIDLSIASQQGVIEGLRQLQQGKARPQQPVAESLA